MTEKHRTAPSFRSSAVVDGKVSMMSRKKQTYFRFDENKIKDFFVCFLANLCFDFKQ